MERQSMVHRVVVDHGGRSYYAHYFVEDGVIHANLDGTIQRRLMANAEPADTVRAMLLGHLAQRTRKLTAVAGWTAKEHPRLDLS